MSRIGGGDDALPGTLSTDGAGGGDGGVDDGAASMDGANGNSTDVAGDGGSSDSDGGVGGIVLDAIDMAPVDAVAMA
ncbi:MAG: hypothetical protein QOI66_5331, partial [Myxococcales bacterium]|nr:hypothetical protein [Myxococcales bacterium]